MRALKLTLLSFACAMMLCCNYAQAGGGGGSSDDAKTRFPIVLIHGLGGNTAPYNSDYWPGIKSWISNEGGTYIEPNLGRYTNAETQGQTLVTELENWKSANDKPDMVFNLIGHSKGGLVARVALKDTSNENDVSNLIATIATIATPHNGTGISSHSDFASVGRILTDIISTGGVEDFSTVKADIERLSIENMKQFNNKYPKGVVAGNSGTINGNHSCRRPNTAEQFLGYFTDSDSGQRRKIMGVSWTGVIYPSRTHLAIAGDSTNVTEGEFKAFWENVMGIEPSYLANRITQFMHGDAANDGLVPVCGSMFADWYGMSGGVDHNDAVGQVGGVGLGKGIDKIKSHIRRLKANNF